jgi:hypothetical protein
MLNWVEIRGVKRLIKEPGDRSVNKLVPNFIGNMDRSVILHKYIPFIQVVKNKADFCF